MAGDDEAVAAKTKQQSKRPSGSRQKGAENGGKGERRSTEEHKPRRDSGSRIRELSGTDNDDDDDGPLPPQKQGGIADRRPAGKVERPSSRSPSRKAQSNKNGTSTDCNNRYRNRSRSPNQQAASATNSKPTRRSSDAKKHNNTSLDQALGSAAGNKKQKDAEEQSMGDFAKYQGKLGAGLLGTLDANHNSFVPEESLGSFTGFIKKYEQEELLGLHDKPGAYNPYEQQLKKPKQQLQKPKNIDASMSDMISPMQQYGGLTAKQSSDAAEESLGSFTQFAEKYEKDKLLGLQDSELSAPPIPVQKDEPHIPEESMDVLELVGDGKEDEQPTNQEKEPQIGNYYGQEIDIDLAEADIDLDEIIGSNSEDDEDKEEKMIKLPPSRIERLKKDGAVRYQIMVDSPGGHSSEPMKIVVAIEFEDDSDEEGEKQDKKEDPYEVAARLSHEDLYKGKQSSSYFDHNKADIDSDGNQSEEEENEKSHFLAGHMNRLSQHSALSKTSPVAPNTVPEHSTSTHSTTSSLSNSSHIQIHSDACPSNQNAIRRQPRQPSVVAPHNLGTRRGLLLRQMSEASMKSSMSNASSYVDPSNLPEDYKASFMQLNLLDLNQTQMQSNEEVEKAILPVALPSGIEEIPEGEEEAEPNLSPAGKEPQIASQELLGMKTMLKHITKRAAPRRTKSFDFDRETKKAMWNSLFARSQKNELPGSQYVDNDESIGHDDDHVSENVNNDLIRGEGQSSEAEAGEKENPQAKKSGFLSAIKKVTSKPRDKDEKEKSASKGKSSLWSGMTFKSKIRPREEGEEPGACGDDNASQGSNGEEEQQREEQDSENDEHNVEEDTKNEQSDDDHSEEKRRRRHRRKAGEKREGSTRSAGRSSLKEHRPQRRTGPARNRAKDSTNIHNRSLSGALDFYTAEQEGSEEEGGNGGMEPLKPVQEDIDGLPKRKVRPRRKPPTRTKSDIGGHATTRQLPNKTRSTDGLKGMPNRTRSSPADSSPPRQPRTSRIDEKNPSTKAKAKAPVARRTKSTPEGKERKRNHDKGAAVKHKVDEIKPPILNKPPVNPHGELSGHSRALHLPEDATEEQLRDLLDYH